MSSFVKLDLRCFIFSSHEKSLASIMIPQLEGHGLHCGTWPMGMRGLKLLGFVDLPADSESEQRPYSCDCVYLSTGRGGEKTIK